MLSCLTPQGPFGGGGVRVGGIKFAHTVELPSMDAAAEATKMAAEHGFTERNGRNRCFTW